MDSEEKSAQLYQHVAPEQNPAVALCYESFTRALKEAEEDLHMFRGEAVDLARKVYQKAMPPLAGRENIQNFIACVAHAMLLGIIEPADATRLLYAAQVAQSGSSREQPREKSS